MVLMRPTVEAPIGGDIPGLAGALTVSDIGQPDCRCESNARNELATGCMPRSLDYSIGPREQSVANGDAKRLRRLQVVRSGNVRILENQPSLSPRLLSSGYG